LAVSTHRPRVGIVHRQNDDVHGIRRFMRDGHTEVVKVHGALSSNDGEFVLGWVRRDRHSRPPALSA
jgi:hypothetical protein